MVATHRPGSANPELQLLVEPDAAIVPIVAAPPSSGATKAVDIYQVASVMEQKGWNMFTGQHPPVMSVCLGEQHLKTMDLMLKDLKVRDASSYGFLPVLCVCIVRKKHFPPHHL